MLSLSIKSTVKNTEVRRSIKLKYHIKQHIHNFMLVHVSYTLLAVRKMI